MKKLIIVFFLFLCSCSTKINPLAKTDADVNKQTYILSCPNNMLINLVIYKDKRAFEYHRTSSASFATQSVVVEKNEGIVEYTGENSMRLIQSGASKKTMMLGLKKDNFFSLKNYDDLNSKGDCEGALFVPVY